MLPVSVITLGAGTASSEILDYFGLDGSEKSVMFHMVTDEKWKEVKHQLRMKMSIDIPGIGNAYKRFGEQILVVFLSLFYLFVKPTHFQSSSPLRKFGQRTNFGTN